ncbi:unnamed protein product [Gongylonema pulchrum]|uniref:SERPIN domain-containing protein n=1 Tax=Gongylonema pulchrum TaxID=637853 RepID=A0A183EQX1_9BILA|nr:unnamed protein product [Gongylonema pulchrum]
MQCDRLIIGQNNYRNITTVDMMVMKEHFSYYEDQDVQVLGMPYSGGQTQMLIILPQQRFGLADVEQKLTGKKLLSYVQQSHDAEVEVELPRFKLEKRLELVEALQKLGMGLAFSDFATFTGISEEPLKISDVIQKAFIEVSLIQKLNLANKKARIKVGAV